MIEEAEKEVKENERRQRRRIRFRRIRDQNQITKAEQYEGQAQQWAELFDNHNATQWKE